MLTDEQKEQLLDDFLAWTGGELPVSREQIVVYLEVSCPFPFAHEQEAETIDFLVSKIM
jgi:hypothetical protein